MKHYPDSLTATARSQATPARAIWAVWVASLCFAPLTASTAAAQDLGAPKVPSPLPAFDLDAKTDACMPPFKDGVVAVGNERLSLAERIALNQRLDAQRHGHGAERAAGLVREDAASKADPSDDLSRYVGKTPITRRFQLDEPGDGNLWVFGGTYKARFGRDGASYIPFLGSAAPQNFPLTLRLDSITVGGEALALDLEAAPKFEGQAAVYRRGAAIERYDVALGRCEQVFEFAQLPANGDLVLTLDVQSELVGQAQADGLAFNSALGGVTYSGAVAIDAHGRRRALSTDLVDGDIRIVLPAEFIAGAAFPLVIDPVIATWAPTLSPTSDDFASDIAYDASFNRFLVVYEQAYSATDHDVWGELFDPSTGSAIAGSGAYIDYTTSYWARPRCANNRIASQFLVVAERRGTPTDVWGRTREAESIVQGLQFQISVNILNKATPDVGGDPALAGPTYYCVVWESQYAVGVDHDIHARLVDATSTLIGPGTISLDSSTSTYDRWPTISKLDGLPPYATQNWTIVWNRQYTPSDWDIFGAQIHWDGTVAAPTYMVDFSTFDDRSPTVSTILEPTALGRPYVVTYERDSLLDYAVVAQAMQGSTFLSRVNLTSLLAVSADMISPSVETDGHQFGVAWSQRYTPGSTDFDIYVAGLYLAGSQLYVSEGPVNLAYSSTYEGEPQVCSLYGQGYQSSWLGVSWLDFDGTQGNIEAATYALPDHYGPFIGANYCSPAVANSTGQSAVIEASGAGWAGGRPLHLIATKLPQSVFGYFLGSPTAQHVTTASTVGYVCVGNPLSRFNGPGQVGNTGSTGTIGLDVNTQSIPLPSGATLVLTAGTTYRFQCWYRDGATSNLTDAVSVLFH